MTPRIFVFKIHGSGFFSVFVNKILNSKLNNSVKAVEMSSLTIYPTFFLSPVLLFLKHVSLVNKRTICWFKTISIKKREENKLMSYIIIKKNEPD